MSSSTLSILAKAGVPAAFVGSLLGAPSVTHAADFEVDDPADAHDVNPGDGICRGWRPHSCTLRAAIEEANATAAHDVIRVPGPSSYVLEYGELLVSESVAIHGEPGVVVDADGMSRVFFVDDGSATITDLAIIGGFSGENGGGVLVGTHARVHLARCVVERNDSHLRGAGIANFGELHVERTSVRNNENDQFDDAGGGAMSTGGGIHNADDAVLVVEQSSIVGNLAFRGGGISNINGSVWITDSTISGNVAGSRGAGLLTEAGEDNSAQVDIQRSTITDNTILFSDTTELIGGAGIANVMSYVSIHASIVAANIHDNAGYYEYAPDCADFGWYVGYPGLTEPGTYWSASYNLMGDLAGCDAFDPATEDIIPLDDEPIDPLLGPLVPWTLGGTELHIPSAQSPAVLAGPRCQLPPVPNTPIPNCYDVDQRGYLRSSGEPATDIGAYERNGTPPPPPRGG